MVKKISTRDFLVRVLSFLIALGLWFYVSYAENPEIEVWFDGVELTYIGDNALTSHNLVRNTGNDLNRVSLKVRGSRKAILSLSSHDITANVDLTSITTASTYSLPIIAKFPDNTLTVVDKKPYNISVTTEDLVSKELRVDTEIVGTPADSFTVSHYTSSVTKVKVSGAASVLKNADSCVAQVNVDGLDAGKTVPAQIMLRLSDGSIAEDSTLSFSNTYTSVSLSLYTTISVPVRAIITNQNDVSVKNVKITPATVNITGEASLLSDITEVLTQPISLSRGFDTETIDVPLSLPQGVRTADDTDSVKLEITIDKASVLTNG